MTQAGTLRLVGEGNQALDQNGLRNRPIASEMTFYVHGAFSRVDHSPSVAVSRRSVTNSLTMRGRVLRGRWNALQPICPAQNHTLRVTASRSGCLKNQG